MTKEDRTLRALSKAFLTASLLLTLAPLPAKAMPELQLYIEGAVYDAATESWVLDGASTVRLWAIGNVGAKGTISNVHLAISYAGVATPVLLTLTPSTTGGLGGFTDPSDSAGATLLRTVTDGTKPTLSDGKDLPNHGHFGPGVHWQEFDLGDFTLTDSPIADFIDAFPAPSAHDGQIDVYEINANGADSLHFDLYNSYQSRTQAKAIFAPFSHDANGITQLPEPGPLALMAAGLLALVLIRRRPV